MTYRNTKVLQRYSFKIADDLINQYAEATKSHDVMKKQAKAIADREVLYARKQKASIVAGSYREIDKMNAIEQ